MGLQKKKREKFACWAFLTPTLIFLAVTALFPLLYSVYLSFFRVKLNMPNQKPVFVGLSNYIKMISDDMLHVSTWNTMVFAFISVALEVILGLMVAMVICSDKMWSRVVTSLFMIPMIMAPVAIGTLCWLHPMAGRSHNGEDFCIVGQCLATDPLGYCYLLCWSEGIAPGLYSSGLGGWR